jgi:hypothetical protein
MIATTMYMHADNDNNSTSAVSGNNDAQPLSGPDEGTSCPCRQHYEDSGKVNKKVLYLMSIGVTHNDAPLFSFEMAPWSLRLEIDARNSDRREKDFV